MARVAACSGVRARSVVGPLYCGSRSDSHVNDAIGVFEAAVVHSLRALAASIPDRDGSARRVSCRRLE